LKPTAGLFGSSVYTCLELSEDDVGRVQRFFEANPEYHLAVTGAPPGPGAAREEFDSLPPPDWQCGKRWLLQFVDGRGDIAAIADVIADLIAPGVWHVGLFVVATSLHGSGAAHALYESLEAWMREGGARWLRLGAVVGNTRAERFWQRVGYTEVRQREGIAMGERVNTVRVMVKPLTRGRMDEYLALVSRDRPESLEA
jgi:GNAT superfamily N-acetyltransferase